MGSRNEKKQDQHSPDPTRCLCLFLKFVSIQRYSSKMKYATVQKVKAIPLFLIRFYITLYMDKIKNNFVEACFTVTRKQFSMHVRYEMLGTDYHGIKKKLFMFSLKACNQVQ